MKQPKFAKEVGKMKSEKWLPIETQLVVWSLVSGALLLVVLIWISQRFFPAGG